jgi:hypothetical protein
MPGKPGDTRRTAHGYAVRTETAWRWQCDHCDRGAVLGLGSDVQDFDAGRWLDAIDSNHRCEHKEQDVKGD